MGMLEEADIIQQLSDLKHRIFPRPFERLALKGGDLVGCEIGVYKGNHSESLLASSSIKKLYLIDPYDMYENYIEGHAHYGVDQAPLSEAEKEAMSRLSSYNDRTVWINLFSDAACKVITEKLDFVYIDGNHAYEFVKADIENYYPLLKSGGILGGHDFYNGYCWEHDGVIKAVTEFAVKNGLGLKVELPDWWIVKP